MKNFRCLPVGNLPYTDIKAATKMIVKLFENVPYLPDFPNVFPDEDLLKRTLTKAPGIFKKDNKIIFNNEAKDLNAKLISLDSAFNKLENDCFEPFSFNLYFLSRYLQIIERVKPKNTVINFLGPFSTSQSVESKDGSAIIANQICRKEIIQLISVKALWLICIIKLASPETVPVIMLDEPLLCQLGNVKRDNEDVTSDTIVNMYLRIVEKLHAYGAKVGVQCFEKCDWNVPIDAGVDYISFGAYNNPHNLNIIAEKVNDFLAKGGRINWGIVPVKNETLVKSLTIDSIYNRFIKTIDGLVESGVSDRLAYNRSTVSVQGNLSHLPIIFAEKAIILATQVAKRIPIKH